MLGIEKAYLDLALKALLRANNALEDLSLSYAIREVSGGKADTKGIDSITEQIIIAETQNFDSNLVVITEEKGKIPEDLMLDKDKVVFFCDPTDRSKPLEQFIAEQLKVHTKDNTTVRQILDPNKWRESYGNPIVSGAYGSITAVREGRILFNAMVNYVTQQMFVACPLGVFYFDVSERKIPSEFKEPDCKHFTFPKKASSKFVTFLAKPKYVRNLNQSELELLPADCVIKDPGGPARILYLSSLYTEQDVGFIMGNGEKIGEWLGWLAYAIYARDAADPSKPALRVDQISFEDAGTRELVLMAVGPHLSIFEQREGKLYVNLDKLKYFTGTPSPNHYRETILITHPDNVEKIVHKLNSTGTCRQLHF